VSNLQIPFSSIYQQTTHYMLHTLHLGPALLYLYSVWPLSLLFLAITNTIRYSHNGHFCLIYCRHRWSAVNSFAIYSTVTPWRSCRCRLKKSLPKKIAHYCLIVRNSPPRRRLFQQGRFFQVVTKSLRSWKTCLSCGHVWHYIAYIIIIFVD